VHLKALEKKGYRARGRSARHPLVDHRPPARVSFLGKVAAGPPINAAGANERLRSTKLRRPNGSCCKSTATPMINSHIQDGDYFVIQQQQTAANGERVVDG